MALTRDFKDTFAEFVIERRWQLHKRRGYGH